MTTGARHCLSKKLIEEPGRTWSPLASSTRITFAAMVAGAIMVAVAAGVLSWNYDRQVAQAEAEMPSRATEPCHGAAARVPDSGCGDPYGPATVVDMGPANRYWILPRECRNPPKSIKIDSMSFCDFGFGAPTPPVVWLIGDSHAQQWLGPLVDLAREHRWMFKVAFQGGCPFAKVQFRGFQESWSAERTQYCMAWTAEVAELIANDRPAIVFTTFSPARSMPTTTPDDRRPSSIGTASRRTGGSGPARAPRSWC